MTHSADRFHLKNGERASVQAKILGLAGISLPQWLQACRKAIQLGNEEVLHVPFTLVRM